MSVCHGIGLVDIFPPTSSVVGLNLGVFFIVSSLFFFAKSECQPGEVSSHLFLILNNGALSTQILPVALRLSGFKPREVLSDCFSSHYRIVSYLFLQRPASRGFICFLTGASFDVTCIKECY